LLYFASSNANRHKQILRRGGNVHLTLAVASNDLLYTHVWRTGLLAASCTVCLVGGEFGRKSVKGEIMCTEIYCKCRQCNLVLCNLLTVVCKGKINHWHWLPYCCTAHISLLTSN